MYRTFWQTIRLQPIGVQVQKHTPMQHQKNIVMHHVLWSLKTIRLWLKMNEQWKNNIKHRKIQNIVHIEQVPNTYPCLLIVTRV